MADLTPAYPTDPQAYASAKSKLAYKMDPRMNEFAPSQRMNEFAPSPRMDDQIKEADKADPNLYHPVPRGDLDN